ncbi:hypothetical protein CVT26_007590 [Gymnopilus dilepis]|uniref:U three protein 23 n=1 Tax=Gymnopilus dilepis TaxID=231916 RepID=A0A409VZS3_9AGAR|nr:hypothetical protein CVT26_007590 [Gymnopilus dilepis]
MRQKRAKAYRKLMHLYSMFFGFRQPYQVLVDSEMCKEAISQKNDFVKQLQTVLHGEVKPMITQCCIHELYLQGKSQQPAVDLAKTFERRKCNHREPIAGDDCISSVVGDKNKHRYVVATQSHPLRVKLRSVPATPIVHVNRSVMVLEPPSDATLRAKALNEEQNMHATTSDLALVGNDPKPEQPPKKRKGPKGPNPLSVKKKKKPTEAPKPRQEGKQPYNSATVDVGSKRKAEDSGDESDDEQDEKTTSGDAKRKRKRRRRKTQTTAEGSGTHVEVTNA